MYDDSIPMERYTIVLTHTFLTKKGESFNIEEPMFIETCVPRFERYSPSIVVDAMMDKMKGALMERIRERTMPTPWERGDSDV